jgi:arginase
VDGKIVAVSQSKTPVQLLQAPYDSGHFALRMGAGPSALAAAGAADRLRAGGHDVREQVVAPTSSWRAELKTTFELHHAIAAAAGLAYRAGRVPLLLSGNCNGTVGMLAALHATPWSSLGKRVGLVWLDAHADFNTPEIDPWGFLDGQGLAMTVGRCWQALTATVPGFTPLPERRVLLIGARSLDPTEEPALRASEIVWLRPVQARNPAAIRAAVGRIAAYTDVVHVHVDLDVHDPSIAAANSYAAPDGLTANQVQKVVQYVADELPVASATLASYDPDYDPLGRMCQTALDLLELLADLVTPVPTAN